MRIYIASDMHIGSEDSNYPAILEFLDRVKVDADELILLGDTLELWTNTMQNITTQEPYKTAYDAIMDIGSTIPVTMLCGNHDYNLKGKVSNKKIKVRKHLVRDKCLFTHGWEFDAAQVVASPLFLYILTYVPYIYQKYIHKPENKYTLFQDGNKRIDRAARDLAKKKGYEHIFFGHTHVPKIDGPLINCGDMVRNASYIVITQGVAVLYDLEKGKN